MAPARRRSSSVRLLAGAFIAAIAGRHPRWPAALGGPPSDTPGRCPHWREIKDARAARPGAGPCRLPPSCCPAGTARRSFLRRAVMAWPAVISARSLRSWQLRGCRQGATALGFPWVVVRGAAMVTGPGDELAASAAGRGRLRVSDAEREQVIGTVK